MTSKKAAALLVNVVVATAAELAANKAAKEIKKKTRPTFPPYHPRFFQCTPTSPSTLKNHRGLVATISSLRAR